MFCTNRISIAYPVCNHSQLFLDSLLLVPVRETNATTSQLGWLQDTFYQLAFKFLEMDGGRLREKDKADRRQVQSHVQY